MCRYCRPDTLPGNLEAEWMYLKCQDMAIYVAGFSEIIAIAPDVKALEVMFRRNRSMLSDEHACWDKTIFLFRTVLEKSHAARKSGNPVRAKS